MVILIVEDNEELKDVLNKLLTSEGHQVFTASNGKEALSVLEGVHADLIITDLGMPDMEGLEFIRKIRSDKNDTVKIIAISGIRYGAGNYLNMAKTFGANAILEKPFNLEQLLTLVNEL